MTEKKFYIAGIVVPAVCLLAVDMFLGSIILSVVTGIIGLLMNLKKLRDVQLDQRFLEVLNQYHFDTIAPDQDYINVLCHGNILYLPECWDVMPGQNKPELAAPRLIHYNLFFKPWCYDGIQYSEVFWQYARESGYLTEIEENKRNYSDAQKEADSECLAKLIRTGAEIAARDFNFRTVFNSGKERRLI